MVESSVKDIDSSVNNIDSSVNLIEQLKAIPKEVLYGFAIRYLVSHPYINNKKLAIYYVCEVYDLTPTRSKYSEIKKVLSYRFTHIITKLKNEGKIVKYSSKVYKRVDPVVIQNTIPLLTREKTHLVYCQGKFVNPKYYDIPEKVKGKNFFELFVK